MAEKLRVVHYLNQFFAGFGGEEKAGLPPGLEPGAVGAARALQQALGDDGEVVATLFCGDNSFAEHPEETTAELLRLIAAHKPDLLIAGPAFDAGRYGVACGALCAAAQRELGIAAVAAMDADNTGADVHRRDVYIVPSGRLATQMLPVLRRVVALGKKLAIGQSLGSPSDEGYLPRGRVEFRFAELPAEQRVVDMLLAKLRGDAFESEVVPTKFETWTPATPVRDLSTAVIALVTDGGLVPEGNPDRMDPSGARRFSALPIADLNALSASAYDVYHSGYDTTYANGDPHRLVPLDVMRELEREGRFGRLHEYLYATAGIGADVESSARTGQGIAERLKASGVDGVILTST
jgi:glycine reductase complex component B subunit gamma